MRLAQVNWSSRLVPFLDKWPDETELPIVIGTWNYLYDVMKCNGVPPVLTRS